jgi:hypothetical protein
MRLRAKIDRQPEWDERFSGWAEKFIRKNMWKCEGHDPEEKLRDLRQDAYLTFRHVLASYPLISKPSHIMALFKVAMRNEYIDKAKYKQRKTAVEVSLDSKISEDLKLGDVLGEDNNEGLLRVILSELPPEVRLALEVFNDEEKLALLRQERVQSKLSILAGLPFKKESFNDALCRIIRLPKGTNLVGMIKSSLAK